MRKNLILVVQPELTDKSTAHPDSADQPLAPRLEERARWLMFADMGLRKKKVEKMMATLRAEQERIKRQIQPQVENYKQLKGRAFKAG